jgi:glycerate dehydrogenase
MIGLAPRAAGSDGPSPLAAPDDHWRVYNGRGARRVMVTKELPGELWLRALTAADCRVEVCATTEALDQAAIVAAIGGHCDAAIGQLTESWGEESFECLRSAGGTAYSNYAVGYDNVDVAAATRRGIAVGNTPGVLTETTAELAVALTFAAARRIVESSRYLAAGRFGGWLPGLFLGKLLYGKTVGVVGAGRIGAAYARMLVEGHKMDLLYYDVHPNRELEDYLARYSALLVADGQRAVTCRRTDTLEELLRAADVVSIHAGLDRGTLHLIDGARLAQMKDDAILVNSSRGALLDEAALVEHCRSHPAFHAGLDVFEQEPDTAPGLLELPNVVSVPHLGSATRWTRESMATLAARNVAGLLSGWPVWRDNDVTAFLTSAAPQAAPSVVNAHELGLPVLDRGARS